MNVIAYIQGLIAQIFMGSSPALPFSFIYGWKSYQNLSADELTEPICILDLPIQVKTSIKNTGYIERRYTCGLFFAMREDLGTKPSDIQAHIQAMALAARSFMTKLFNDQENVPRNSISINQETDVYFVYDSALCGWYLNLTFTIYDNTSIC